MIPFDDLVAALAIWRERNGLPVGAADYLGEAAPVSYANLAPAVETNDDIDVIEEEFATSPDETDEFGTPVEEYEASDYPEDYSETFAAEEDVVSLGEEETALGADAKALAEGTGEFSADALGDAELPAPADLFSANDAIVANYADDEPTAFGPGPEVEPAGPDATQPVDPSDLVDIGDESTQIAEEPMEAGADELVVDELVVDEFDSTTRTYGDESAIDADLLVVGDQSVDAELPPPLADAEDDATLIGVSPPGPVPVDDED